MRLAGQVLFGVDVLALARITGGGAGFEDAGEQRSPGSVVVAAMRTAAGSAMGSRGRAA